MKEPDPTQIIYISFQEWNALYDSCLLTDISHQERGGFLMIHQVMKGKILYKGTEYFVSAWNPPGFKAPYVVIAPAKLGVSRL